MSDHREGEPVHLQAQVDIVGMNTPVSASHPVSKIGGCPGGPRTVEIRGHLGIASGEMLTDVFIPDRARCNGSSTAPVIGPDNSARRACRRPAR